MNEILHLTTPTTLIDTNLSLLLCHKPRNGNGCARCKKQNFGTELHTNCAIQSLRNALPTPLRHKGKQKNGADEGSEGVRLDSRTGLAFRVTGLGFEFARSRIL